VCLNVGRPADAAIQLVLLKVSEQAVPAERVATGQTHWLDVQLEADAAEELSLEHALLHFQRVVVQLLFLQLSDQSLVFTRVTLLVQHLSQTAALDVEARVGDVGIGAERRFTDVFEGLPCHHLGRYLVERA